MNNMCVKDKSSLLHLHLRSFKVGDVVEVHESFVPGLPLKCNHFSEKLQEVRLAKVVFAGEHFITVEYCDVPDVYSHPKVWKESFGCPEIRVIRKHKKGRAA